MVKFFQLCAIAIILSVAVSCGNVAESSTTPQVSGPHSITISYIKNGSGENHGEVTASKTSDIAPGEKIYLAITPENGYQLDKLYYDGGSEKNIDVTDNSFVMPNKNVNIYASFKEQASTYTVRSSDIENGEILFFFGSNSPQDSLQASKGTTVSILVLPNGGFEVDTLTASASGKELAIYENTFAMPEEDVTVGATFKASASSYTVKSSENQNGNVLFSVGNRSPETSVSVAKGTTVAIKATPDSGYALYSLTVKDASEKEIQVMQNTFAMPESDVTVNAVFKKIYTITLNKNDHGYITVETPRGAFTTENDSQTVTALAGETIAYDASPNSGYKFNHYTFTGVEVSEAGAKTGEFVMPESDVTISETFKMLENIAIQIAGTTNGTVTADKNSAKAGEKVKLTVTPATGGAGEKDYVVEMLYIEYKYYDHWDESIANKVPAALDIPIDPAGGQVEFTVPDSTGPVTVQSGFAEKKYAIKLADGITGGSITGINANGYYMGEKVCLVVTPNDGYKTDKSRIRITGASVTLDDFYCFDMPKADITIGATFASGAAGHTITVNPSANGSVSFNKTTNIMPGSTVELIANPAENYRLYAFSVTNNDSGAPVASSGNFFIMPDSDVAVSAEFIDAAARKIYVRTSVGGNTNYYRDKIMPSARVELDAPDGYAFETAFVSSVPDVGPSSERGEQFTPVSFEDNQTKMSFTMDTTDMLVEVDLKARVKAKPDTIGDIVLNDGTAVARENRGKLSESQKKNAIAVIFYDGRTENARVVSNFLGSCVLGVGLVEGDGPWCVDYEDDQWANFHSMNPHPINICGGSCWSGHTYYENGQEILETQYFGGHISVYTIDVDIRFDGQLRGKDNYEVIQQSGAVRYPYAFNFCHDYKDQEGSRVKGTAYETGWYLPALPELAELLRCVMSEGEAEISCLNECLAAVRGVQLKTRMNDDRDYYWSSGQAKQNQCAWVLRSDSYCTDMLNEDKIRSHHIRAIREF